MQKLTVLVVDDEKLVRKGIISVFPWKECGMDVAGEAGTGTEALEVLRQQRVNIMFTDLNMPGMDGIELTKRVKKEYPAVGIVVLTCYQDFSYAQQALRLGVLDYIVKTQLDQDRINELLTRIRNTYIDRNYYRMDERSPDFSTDLNDVSKATGYSPAVIRKIHQAAAYISDNLHSVSQDYLADEIGLSRSYFSQCFRDVMSLSFRAYLHNEKMKNAKLLLETTSIPVYEIASKVGFQDSKYFSRLFREETGSSPSEYRDAVRRSLYS